MSHARMDDGILGYEERFSGVLGSEYNLFAKSVPWHDEFQDVLKRTIREYCLGKSEAATFTALDAGCGTGITTIRILDADERIRVVAVDNEEKTLDQAKEALRDKADRVTFIQADLLPFLEGADDDSFDVFASAYVLHNLPCEYRNRVLKEIARVLKSGGLFVNADKYAHDDEEQQAKDLEEQIRDFDVFDKLGRQDIREEWTKHYREDEKIRITEGEQVRILASLGFDDIRTVFRKRIEAVIRAVKV